MKLVCMEYLNTSLQLMLKSSVFVNYLLSSILDFTNEIDIYNCNLYWLIDFGE